MGYTPSGEPERTEAQSDLAFALKMYGQAMIDHAATDDVRKDATFDNMVFWQNQAWMAAQAVAKENTTV